MSEIEEKLELSRLTEADPEIGLQQIKGFVIPEKTANKVLHYPGLTTLTYEYCIFIVHCTASLSLVFSSFIGLFRIVFLA